MPRCVAPCGATARSCCRSAEHGMRVEVRALVTCSNRAATTSSSVEAVRRAGSAPVRSLPAPQGPRSTPRACSTRPSSAAAALPGASRWSPRPRPRPGGRDCGCAGAPHLPVTLTRRCRATGPAHRRRGSPGRAACRRSRRQRRGCCSSAAAAARRPGPSTTKVARARSASRPLPVVAASATDRLHHRRLRRRPARRPPPPPPPNWPAPAMPTCAPALLAPPAPTARRSAGFDTAAQRLDRRRPALTSAPAPRQARPAGALAQRQRRRLGTPARRRRPAGATALGLRQARSGRTSPRRRTHDTRPNAWRAGRTGARTASPAPRRASPSTSPISTPWRAGARLHHPRRRRAIVRDADLEPGPPIRVELHAGARQATVDPPRAVRRPGPRAADCADQIPTRMVGQPQPKSKPGENSHGNTPCPNCPMPRTPWPAHLGRNLRVPTASTTTPTWST